MNASFLPVDWLLLVPFLEKVISSKNSTAWDVTANRSRHQIKNGDIVLIYYGMLCMGKPWFEAVHEMDDDREFYRAASGITRSISSEEALRQRMDDNPPGTEC